MNERDEPSGGWYSRALDSPGRWRPAMGAERISGRWLAVVYAVLSTWFCWPLFADPLAAGAGDWDQHILYYAAVLRNAAFGDLPFWNPWYCGGNVLWANPQVSLVSPVYLLALVMPLTLAMKINIVAHYLVGCLGMHLVVRRIVGVKGTAVTVFLVSLFVFSGGIALHLQAGHTVYLPVLLLPMVVFCFYGGSHRCCLAAPCSSSAAPTQRRESFQPWRSCAARTSTTRGRSRNPTSCRRK